MQNENTAAATPTHATSSESTAGGGTSLIAASAIIAAVGATSYFGFQYFLGKVMGFVECIGSNPELWASFLWR